MHKKDKILLIGAGKMGAEYIKILKDLGVDFFVHTRSEERALNIEKAMKIPVSFGEINRIENIESFTHAINAASLLSLSEVTESLIKGGIKKLLIEKPAGVYEKKLVDNKTIAKEENCDLYVAYNRRFYASVMEAEKIIENDGGLKSVAFEFTEWIDKIDFSKRKGEREHWFLTNSSHVIDLAFYFAGEPEDYKCYSKNDAYVGSGVTKKGIYFSYNANWDAPGRWGLELLTKNYRIYLKPMEELHIQKRNSVEINKVEIKDDKDRKYKPGLYREVLEFLKESPDNRLKTLDEQINSFKIYNEIIKGN